MGSQRDLQQVVEQINQSYSRLLKQITKLEEQVALLGKAQDSNTTKTTKSKEKS